MSPEILITRDGDGYRVLHGHLHLATLLTLSNEAIVEASGEGKVKVIKTRDGILIGEKASVFFCRSNGTNRPPCERAQMPAEPLAYAAKSVSG